MHRPLIERWLDELESQLCDPFVIDDPSLGTSRIAHKARTLRRMRGVGRDRAWRALRREVAGLASVCPGRFDLDTLERTLREEDVQVECRDSDATMIQHVPRIRRTAAAR